MRTEFGGEPVTGGMLPAQIWKRFMESVDEDEDESFPSPPYLGASPSWVVKRQGEWQLDNGYCREARLLVYLSAYARFETTADCKPNEVSVPLVVDMTVEEAIAEPGDRPLGRVIAHAPSRSPEPSPASSRNCEPRRGGSAGDDVQLWVSKAQHGWGLRTSSGRASRTPTRETSGG